MHTQQPSKSLFLLSRLEKVSPAAQLLARTRFSTFSSNKTPVRTANGVLHGGSEGVRLVDGQTPTADRHAISRDPPVRDKGTHVAS